MGYELVGLCCGSVKGYRGIHFIIRAERDFWVSDIDRGGRGINQMLRPIIVAGLKNVVKADLVRFDIDIGMIDRVPNTRLGSQVNYDGGLILRKNLVDQLLVGNGTLYEHMVS